MNRPPEFDDLVALPCYLRRTVPEEYGDANGHMNVTGYLRLHDEAAWPFMADKGMGDDYLRDRRMSIFDLEHHLRYVDEVLVGATVEVRVRTLGRTAKVFHAQWYLLDRDNERLANTFEFLTAHVSLDTRRTTEFSPEVADLLDADIAASDAMDWDAPLSGALRLRR